MEEKKDLEMIAEEENLSDEELEQVAGGRMRGVIVTNPTTDISDDTKENI